MTLDLGLWTLDSASRITAELAEMMMMMFAYSAYFAVNLNSKTQTLSFEESR
jgi:hypothetical protein